MLANCLPNGREMDARDSKSRDKLPQKVSRIAKGSLEISLVSYWNLFGNKNGVLRSLKCRAPIQSHTQGVTTQQFPTLTLIRIYWVLKKTTSRSGTRRDGRYDVSQICVVRMNLLDCNDCGRACSLRTATWSFNGCCKQKARGMVQQRILRFMFRHIWYSKV
jgi:hypothetical protein